MHPEIMTRNGLRVVDIVNGVCQNAQAREDEVQITAGDTILEHNIIISRDDCVAHPGPGKSLELSMAVVPGAPRIDSCRIMFFSCFFSRSRL